MKKKVKGYKVFLADWTCMGFQYKVGKKFVHKGTIEMCSSGFHFCQNICSCFSYYEFDPKNKVAEIEASGEVLGSEEDKQVTNTIKIVREIPWDEVLRIANTGTGNSGYGNSGYRNSGNRNSGNSNSGDRNSGNSNSGYRNSGYSNSGDRNSGYSNSGNSNSGDSNSGYRNSGNRNSGNSNSGNRNSGYRNSGNSNSGYSNSGDSNSGNSNSGIWNSGDFNSGFLNTDEPKVRMFNKQTRKNRNEVQFPDFFYFELTKWILFDDMTVDEKKNYPNAETPYGYLKTLSYQEAWQESWFEATDEDKKKVLKLPNFNAKIFKQITGIDVKKKTRKD